MNAQDCIALVLALASALYALRWMRRSIRSGGGCGRRCNRKLCGGLTVVTRNVDAVTTLPVIPPE
jgi:hypothetical protein